MAFFSRFSAWLASMSRKFLNWTFWSTPFMLWTAHATPVIWVVSALVGPFLREIPWMWIAVPIWFLILVAIIAACFAEFTHEVQMCARCGANTARGARLVRAMMWMHHYRSYALLLPLTVLSLWKMLGEMPSWFREASSVLIFLGFGAFAHALLVHRAHRIWCPYCNDGWEDDPDAPVEPVLDPTPPGRPKPAM